MDTIRWGIISTAKIGVEQVIPAMQQASNCTVAAISSRSAEKARRAADKLGISTSYGSYGDLLEDDSIDAVYNPLPNHLHVPFSIDALQAGKHVLCEKPIALDADEARKLQQASEAHPEQLVMEAFMYRFHPRWQKAKSLVDNGAIGSLQTVESFFSYYNDDPEDIRNNAHMGGGGLMDIGCYCISLSRFLFGREPEQIKGNWKIDPDFDTDYLASGVLDFGDGTATFNCGTQLAPHQRVNMVGTEGRIVMDQPFNTPPDEPTQLWIYKNGRKEELTFDPVDHYTLQAEAFAQAVIEDKQSPVPLQDAVQNMQAIDRFRASAESTN